MKRFLVILLLLVSQSLMAVEVSDRGTLTPDIEWYVTNIKSPTYSISNANELAGLAALVNGTTGFFSPYDFSDKTIVLANDIDLGCTIDSDGAMEGPVWVPIGSTYSTRFAGVFDAAGFCITGMIIRQTDDETGSLFGYSSGTIKNLTIAGGMVTAAYYGASICSHNFGLIDHCINTATIYCNNYGGGICGKNYDEGIIRNCFNFGNVADRNMCGGIVGSLADDAEISNCVYDIQMCPVKKGCGVGDSKYVKGLTTKQIINVQGYMMDNNFDVGNGMYPKLVSTVWTPTTLAALMPVIIPEPQNVNSVSRDVEFKTIDGVTYESSNPQYLTITNNIGFPKEKACVVVKIKGGRCYRTLILKITNDQLKSTGTEQNPLRIANYDDMVRFANAVNYNTDYNGFANVDGFSNVSVVLTSNINIPDDVNWSPIGTLTAPFSGNFTGYGFCVCNMHITRPLDKYCGLFGYSKGNIRKVVLVGGSVIGGDYTGAVCGFNDHGAIEKSISSINVRGHYYTGGICGYNYEGNLSELLNLNYVEGVPESTGGICGVSNGGNVEHCAYDWQMSLTDKAVAVEENAPTVFDSKGYLTDEMIGDKLESKDGFSYDFQYEEDMYPKLISVESHSESVVASTPIFVSKNENIQNLVSFILLLEKEGITYNCNQTSVLKIAKDKALPLKQGSVILSVSDGNVTKNIIVRVSNPSLQASGTADSPLTISSYKDIECLRQAVNMGSDYKGFVCINGFKDVCFKLTADITCPSYVNQSPIGNYLFPFNGTLDGDNHTIRSFNCEHDDLDNIGFIGYNSGTIKNLKLSRSMINGRYYSGGICGYNKGVISNCSHDSASVSGSNYAGGICGFNEGTVVSCRNIGPIQCDYYAGGIMGANNGRLDSCFNSGVISGRSCVGGISGSCSNDILNSVNRGTVMGNDNTGGIVGRNSYATITLCDNKGKITGGDCTGGITGQNDGVIMKCHNDSTVSSTLSAGGITGRGGKIFFCVNRSTVISAGNNAGGISGVIKNGSNAEIKYCINYGNIQSAACAGGIIADNAVAKITSCANFGKIIATYYTGGICGNNNGTLSSSISYGSVSGSSYVGSICGRTNEGSKIESCFYDLLYSNTGGVDSRDITLQAMGLNHEVLLGNGLKDRIINSDFVFDDFKVPVPRME